MNNYQGEVRRRRQNLLIVEGHHEKNKLFWLIFKCFPEININMDEIWIYGTNIYQLYNDIVKEYGEEWAKKNDDIDLPFVISKKKFPDGDFAERKIPVSLQPGKTYKSLAEQETILSSIINFPHRIDDLLEKRFGVSDTEKRKKCCNEILKISSADNIENMIQTALQGEVEDNQMPTIKYQLADWVRKQRYTHINQTYWEYMRSVIQQVILHNICKANRILYGQYQIPEDKYKEYFERLDLTEILKTQNAVSRDFARGFIWVLNTCIYFIAEYNFKLVMDE